MITAIASAFGGVSGAGGESGNIYSGVNSALGAFGLGSNPGDARPAAFLNYILFDANYKVLDMGWTGVPSSANYSKQLISIPQVTVKEAGYIFIYLSYEDQSNNYVYFDDFKVTHTETGVIQSNEYYPFGLQTAESWTRDNSSNNFLYNGGTESNTVTALYDLQYRNYDPALGRFHQVDPMTDKFGSHTPYNFAFNDPVYLNDPNGADPTIDEIWKKIRRFLGIYLSPEEAVEAKEADSAGGGGEGGGDYNYMRITNNGTTTYGYIDGDFAKNSPGYSKDFYIDFDPQKTEIISGDYSKVTYYVEPKYYYSPQKQLQREPTLQSSYSNQFLTVFGADLNIASIATTLSISQAKPRYTGALSWAAQVKAGKAFGTSLGMFGFAITFMDIYQNGFNTSNSLDLLFGGMSFGGGYGAAISGIYFTANTITLGITNQSIGQHIDNNYVIVSSGTPGGVILIPK